MSPEKPSSKPLIGWREWVALPGLGVTAIKAKIDTGARTSSLHAFDIEIVRRRGVEHVQFKVHPYQRNVEKTVECEGLIVDHRTVRSSSGHETVRPVIVTTVELMGRQWEIELTLTARDAMGFRMLLGRGSIKGFLVNPARSYLVSKGPKRKRRKKAQG